MTIIEEFILKTYNNGQKSKMNIKRRFFLLWLSLKIPICVTDNPDVGPTLADRVGPNDFLVCSRAKDWLLVVVEHHLILENYKILHSK